MSARATPRRRRLLGLVALSGWLGVAPAGVTEKDLEDALRLVERTIAGGKGDSPGCSTT